MTRPGSGFFGSVAKTAALIHSSICFFCRSVGWGFLGGRHQISPQILQGFPPEIAIFEKDLIGFERVESHPAFVGSICVTVVTELGENGLDVLAKLRSARKLPGTRWTAKDCEGKQGSHTRRHRHRAAMSPSFCNIRQLDCRFMSQG